MADFTIGKVTTLPATPVANKIYVYQDETGKTGLYVSDKTGGALHQIGGSPPGLDDVLAISNESGRDIYAGGVFVTDESTYDNFIDELGVLANGSGEIFLPAYTGITTNASVVGLLTKRNTDASGISAAVAGVDQTTSGTSKSYAGYFQGDVLITGSISNYNVKTKHVLGLDYTIGSETYICVADATGGTVYLPPNPSDGCMKIITRINSATVTINGNGKNIGYKNNTATSSFNAAWSHTLIYNATLGIWQRVNEIL